MEEEEKKHRLNLLEKMNPFISSSVGDPGAKIYPHVESINKKSYEGLCRLIRQKATNPNLSVAGLVTGEVGEGKTHLLGRILEFCRLEENAYAFAYIQPIEDPDQPYRYLLREMTANLCSPIHAQSRITFIEKLSAKIFAHCLDSFLDRYIDGKKNKIREKLKNDPLVLFRDPKANQSKMLRNLETRAPGMFSDLMPRLPENFISVLLKCREKHLFQLAMRWLKGSPMETDDQKLLGIVYPFDISLQASEQNARDLIQAYGEVMAYFGESAVICFDRLENLDDPRQVHALGKMVEFLVDSVKAVLPIACFRETAWEDRFKIQLNQHVVTRLETNRFFLQGCEPEEGLELVRSRLRTLFGDDELFPFEKSQLLETFKIGGIQSPRRFISLANEMLNTILGMKPEKVSIADQIKAEYSRQLENANSDINRLEPDRNRLRRAILLYIESLPPTGPYRIMEVKPLFKKDKYTDFMCRIVYPNNESKKAIFIIDIEDHHSSVSASLNRGLDFLKKFPDGKAFYIRDGRCPFPDSAKWPETNKILKKFESVGGKLIFFDKEQASAWYALALLGYSIKEGDITITDFYSPARPAKWEEFLGVVREILHAESHQAFEIFDHALIDKDMTFDKSEMGIKNREIADNSVKILKASGGMMMMSGDKMTDNLNKVGFKSDKNQLLHALSLYSDRFEIIPAKDDVIVMLKKDWLYAQCQCL